MGASASALCYDPPCAASTATAPNWKASQFKGRHLDVSRFKGLGEMNPDQVKETTMDPASLSLLKVTLPGQNEDRQPVKDLVARLMGRDPAQRFAFIQNCAAAVDETP